MDEKSVFAALASTPVIFLYSYFVGMFFEIFPCLITCVLTVPACILFGISLRGPATLHLYCLSILLSGPLSFHLGHIPFLIDYQSLLVFFYGCYLGTWLLISSTSKPLKVPAVCVPTHRRLAHVLSSQLIPTIVPRLPKFLTLLSFAACSALIIVQNIFDVNIISLIKQLALVTINLCVFYDTCLETTRLFLSLPPEGLNGKKISEGLAKGDKLSFWECSLFVASDRGNREYVWEISSIGGKLVNWNQIMSPCIKMVTDTAEYIEKNRPRKLDKFRLKKTQLLDVPDLEKVLWSLDTIGTILYHAYVENKNGVTQVHFCQIMKALFDLDATAQNSCAPNILKDRIVSVLYRICTRYSPNVHSIDLPGSYIDKFIQYSDFRV